MEKSYLVRKNMKYYFSNNSIILFLLFISIVFISFQYNNSRTVIDEISESLLSSETIDSKDAEGINNIFTVLKSTEFQIASRLLTVIFSLYIISILLWVLSRIDKLIFRPENSVYYYQFTNAIYKSLYVVIIDMVIQSFYMLSFNHSMEGTTLLIYSFSILIAQGIIVWRMIDVVRNKLFVTSSLIIIALAVTGYMVFGN